MTTAGAWTFTLNQAAADHLAEGASDTQTFTATVTDDKGASPHTTGPRDFSSAVCSSVLTTAAGQDTGTTIEAGNQDNGTVVPGTPTATGTLTSRSEERRVGKEWGGRRAGTYGS